jgi:hypothetical protein
MKWLVIFMLASGQSRSIVGSEADCKLYLDLQAKKALFVDDVGIKRQKPKEVKCQRILAGVDVEG